MRVCSVQGRGWLVGIRLVWLLRQPVVAGPGCQLCLGTAVPTGLRLPGLRGAWGAGPERWGHGVAWRGVPTARDAAVPGASASRRLARALRRTGGDCSSSASALSTTVRLRSDGHRRPVGLGRNCVLAKSRNGSPPFFCFSFEGEQENLPSVFVASWNLLSFFYRERHDHNAVSWGGRAS